ncbi:MAG: cytochrome c biogenesis protein CcsA [Myxococcales bacterium]|nr:cytochrome c biogenesis protein CcsA [Myxococcales bacterium]
MNAIVGSVSLGLALVTAIGTIFVAIRAARTRSPLVSDLARHGVYIVFAFIAVAAAILWHAFLTHDFSLELVYGYSDRRMPVQYLISAFWGGQAGSLLFWVLVMTAAFSVAVTFARRRVPELMPWTYVVMMVNATFFLTLLVFISSPFDTFHLIDVPTDGKGLNPVLQNYWMAIHPPSLLTGYALFSVPFAFGASAIISGRMGLDWIKVTRRALLISWMFLSLGCILGARWAYEELGWGGYWMWDPVENAAILPWFTATALVHSVMIQERRGMLKRWNFVLLVLTFWLTLFGTFLTRSGMIASVHTFAQSSIGPAFMAYVIATAVAGIALLVWRWKKLNPDNSLESTFSREAVFVINNWLMLGFMFVVIWGTLGPKVKDLFVGTDTALPPTWFNRFTNPGGVLLLFFMSVGTLIAWRKATAKNFRKNFIKPLVIATVLTPIAAVVYYRWRIVDLQPDLDPYLVSLAVGTCFLSIFGIAVVVIEFVRGVRSRRSKQKTDVLSATISLFRKHRRRYGGYVVHLGFIMICFGIAGNAFGVSKQATLEVGESTSLGDYLFTYDGIETTSDTHKTSYEFSMRGWHCERDGAGIDQDSCGEARTISPARYDYNDPNRPEMFDPMKMTTEIAILSNPAEDVYITVAGIQPERVTFEFFVNPFVFWLWFGGVVLVGASVLCWWPEWSFAKARSSLRRYGPALEMAVILFVSAVPIVVFLAGRPGAAHAQESRTPIPEQSSEAVDVAVAPSSAEEVNAEDDGHHHGEEDPQLSAHGEDGLVEGVRTENTEVGSIESVIRCQCPDCSGAPIDRCQPSCGWGKEARTEIREMLQEGLTRDQILVRFEETYGPQVIASPDDPVIGWAIPILALVGGALLLVGLVRLMRSFRDGPVVSGPSTAASTPTTGDAYRDRVLLELDELS